MDCIQLEKIAELLDTARYAFLMLSLFFTRNHMLSIEPEEIDLITQEVPQLKFGILKAGKSTNTTF
jgi:hypothetical protein